MRLIIAYAAAIVAMLLLDTIWIGGIASGFYRSRLRPLMASRPNFAAAGLFYVIYVVGVVFFAIMPSNGPGGAAARGALLGLIAYATWDLTNLAVIRDWPASVSAVDMGWGVVITACAAAAGFAASRLA